MFKDLEISDWTRDRMRFRPNSDEMIVDLGNAGRSIAFHTYKKCLIAAGVGDLIDKYNLNVVSKDLLFVRSLSEFFKKKGPSADKHWRYLVDMHRLSDYLPYPDESEFYDDIQDWVQRKPIHTWNGDEEEWYRRFEQKIEAVLFSRGKMPRKITTVDFFCKNSDIWCTSGSGFEPEADKLQVFDLQRKQRETVKKNKWAVRWAMSSGKVKHLLFKRRKQICKAVAKSEPGKVRAVVSSDLSLYLKMSYISLFLDQILKGREDSTLFMTDAQRLELWQKMGIDGTWRMPLDQSEFDKNQSKRQVMIALHAVKKLIIAFGATPDMLTIMDEIIYAVDGGMIFVDGRSIEYQNGVLSGWRWTAFLDTIINLAELSMAEDWVRENSSIQVDILDRNAQGDDDWVKFKTRREAIAVWLAYESFGLFVNPGKFFLARDRDEYLRRVLDGDKLTGYPARSVTSICFRSPLSEREGIGGERVRSVFNRWKLMAERLDTEFLGSTFWRYMCKDASAGLRGSNQTQIDRYCKLGVRYGGIGATKDYYDVDIPTTSEKIPHRLDIEGEGYREWVTFLAQFDIEEREINRFAVSTLDLGGSFGLPKWLKVIFSPWDIVTGVPVERFNGSLAPGCAFIGEPYRYYAYKYRKPFFTTLGDLKGLEQYSEFSWIKPTILPPPTYHKIYQNIKPMRVEVIPEITATAAQLTESYGVYVNPPLTELEHKPKSWVLDFLRGTLKTKMSIIPGWGVDVVGGYSKTFLGDAIQKFLNRRRPHLGFWDSLLANIDVAVSEYLTTLRVRVVE